MVSIHKAGKRTISLFLGAIVLSACADLDIVQQRVTTFGDAVSVTAGAAKLSLATVNQADKEHQILEQAREYAAGNTAVDLTTRPFFTANDMKARKIVLDGLAAYGDGLAGLSGGDPVKRMEKSVSGLGSALEKLTKSDHQIFRYVDTGVVSAAQQGMVFIGKLLVENKLRRELPGLVGAGHQSLIDVVALMKADAAVTMKHLSDLRREHRSDMDGLLRTTAAKGQVSVHGINSILTRYYQRDARFEAEMFALTATGAALDKMVQAHDALKQAVDPKSISVDTSIKSFKAAADEIKDIYNLIRD